MNEDRATRYHRLKRRAASPSLAWTRALLLAGPARQRREHRAANAAIAAASAVAGWRWSRHASSFFYVACSLPAQRDGQLAAGVLQRLRRSSAATACRTSVRRAGCVDQAKVARARLRLLAAPRPILYCAHPPLAGGWWLPAGAVFALLIVGLANLAPVLLLPLFYGVKPLDREALRARLLALAERAGARVLGAYEWGLGEKTKKANAALAGSARRGAFWCRTRCWPNTPTTRSRSCWRTSWRTTCTATSGRGSSFESALILGGFFAGRARARRLVAVARPARRRRYRRAAAAAAAAGAVSLVMLPVAHAMSRAHERSADRFALDADPQSRRRSSRRCGGWRRRISPKSSRRESSNGCSTATRRCASASPRRRRSQLAFTELR